MNEKKSNYTFFNKGDREFRARKVNGKVTEFQEHRKITNLRYYWHKVNNQYLLEVLSYYSEFMRKEQTEANRVLKEAKKNYD